jgi:type VI secretion system secreted protein VgrG
VLANAVVFTCDPSMTNGTPNLHVAVASGAALDVRQFSVHEGLSTLFEVEIVAVSQDPDVDFEAVIGRRAGFWMEVPGRELARTWTGICSRFHQVAVEEKGLSTYEITIVPSLWLATQRRNHRMFQQMSEVEIALELLRDGGIEPEKKLSAEYKKREYRVQYGESDYAFFCRMLEEAGVAFYFAGAKGETRLVLADAPQANELREPKIPFRDDVSANQGHEYVTAVRVGRQVRPGRYTMGEHDFRRDPRHRVAATVSGLGAGEIEGRLEGFHYTPGAFLFESDKGESTPVADRTGRHRTDEGEGAVLAQKRLEAKRGDAKTCSFETSAYDLAPGVVMSMLGHPRSDLSDRAKLLIVESSLRGTRDGAWSLRCEARGAADPYRPPLRTPKPKVPGVESATVVGPPGEEIHTDEFGRVRVQFRWDRETEREQGGSCWLRVSQGWAGGAYGMMALPRVGHEVLVGFIEGDPDQPLVVGRVFNGAAPVPYKLPEHKTRSTWKSDSSPGSEGFNELMFEDAKGRELVYVQAERDLEKLVKHDETIRVGKNRATTVGEVDAAAVGVREVSHISGTRTGREMVAGRITFTTGEATLTLEGPNISLHAAASIMLSAGASILANAGVNVVINGAANITVAAGATAVVRAAGGDLMLEGGPLVKINTGVGTGAGVQAPRMLSFGDVKVVVPPETDVAANLKEAVAHRYGEPGYLMQKLAEGGEWDFTRHGPRYEAFHLFHLGMVGTAMGLPRGALARFAKRRYARPEAGVDYVSPITAAGGAHADGEPERLMLERLRASATRTGGDGA